MGESFEQRNRRSPGKVGVRHQEEPPGLQDIWIRVTAKDHAVNTATTESHCAIRGRVVLKPSWFPMV
jgi:hypothetical protein